MALAACGEKEEDVGGSVQVRGLDLMLDWFPNPDHVAIYQAIESGYFRDVSLDVRPRVPSDPAAPIKQVAAGRADLAISYEPEVLLAREQGLPVVAVAALVQRPLTSLMATEKSGVRSVRDLRGKRVGTAGIPYQEAYLETILRRADVPKSSVKVTNVGASLLPAMLSGKVDATLGAFWNVEGVELRQRRQRPWIVPVNRLGVPDYDELVLVANSDKLDDQRDDMRLFISAAVARRARGAPRSRAPRPTPARRQQGPAGAAHARERARSRSRRCSRRRATSRSATWTRSSGATTAAGWSTTGCSTSCPTSTPRPRTTCCRAKGSRSRPRRPSPDSRRPTGVDQFEGDQAGSYGDGPGRRGPGRPASASAGRPRVERATRQARRTHGT